MANLRDIQRRIKSVKNTGKITRAMQLVAASKMKKAQDQAVASRPYAQLMAEIVSGLFRHLSVEELAAVQSPIFEKREVKKRGILLLSTDKGLCGSLNANLFRALAEIDREKAAFVTVGRKATQFVSRSRRNLLADFSVSDHVLFSELRPVVDFLLNAYYEGEIDTIEVLYTQFINNLKQEAVLINLVPMIGLDDLIQAIIGVQDYTEKAPIENDEREIRFEPSAKEILDAIIPLFISREIYHKVLEAKASEHSARMVAMKTATDNAGELCDSLTLKFNKARQAAITQEIQEISAASAS
ncbi:MAG: ATP synthase F1 subunit gamma [Opitutales bacterium]|nr:ATP synthase F1 subunit gamma [Opitutales bacterium]